MDANKVYYRSFREEELHFVYGVNCYQFAIGYDDPLLMSIQRESGKVLSYLALFPGHAENAHEAAALRQKSRPDMKTLMKLVQKGCAEDGLVATGQQLVRHHGRRTLALFTGVKDLDFHFAHVLRDGSIESKNPYSGIRCHKSIKAYEREGRYRFHQFLHAPQGIVPQSVAHFGFEKTTFYTRRGASVSVMMITPETCKTSWFPQSGKLLFVLDESQQLGLIAPDKVVAALPPLQTADNVRARILRVYKEIEGDGAPYLPPLSFSKRPFGPHLG